MTVIDQPLPAVVVRDATPDDAAFLAWASLTAARSHVPLSIWEVFLGWDQDATLRFVERVMTSPSEHWVHWTQYLIAEVDGAPAAALCAYDPTTHGFEAYLTVATEIAEELMTAEERDAAWTRAELITSCLSEEPVGTWIVESVATRPEHRRRGLADTLLQAALDRGRSRGFGTSQISILIGNEPARACYVKHGFRAVDERRSSDFEALMGTPGIERLQREL